MKNTIKIRPDAKCRIIFSSLAFAVIYLISANATMAAVSTCPNIGNKPFPNGQDSYDIHMDHVTYKGPFQSDSTDSRASLEDGQWKVRLRGYLYYKKSSAGDVENAKVLIFNHGSVAPRPEPCDIVKNFVNAGYVVFAPLRRGHFSKFSEKDSWFEIRSTGLHLDTYFQLCMRSYPEAVNAGRPHLYQGSSDCRLDTRFGRNYDKNAVETDYLRRQRADIREQIEYIKNRTAIGTGGEGKLADPNRITLLGHSFGGSAVIFANEFDYGQNVTIAVSAAEKSWGSHNPYWKIELSAAMQDQARPIYFLGPKNGRTLEPIKTLFGIAVDKEYRSQAAIFPDAPCSDSLPPPCSGESEDWEQFHGTFIGREEQVALWAPTVRNFISRHPR